MDSGVIVALVLGVVFFGGIFWLVVRSRNQSAKHTVKTSIRPPETHHKDRAA